MRCVSCKAQTENGRWSTLSNLSSDNPDTFQERRRHSRAEACPIVTPQSGVGRRTSCGGETEEAGAGIGETPQSGVWRRRSCGGETEEATDPWLPVTGARRGEREAI